MNEETVLYRLDSIDKQLAELVELSKQTALQEVRIAQTEKDIRMVQEDVAGIKNKISTIEKRNGDLALKWIGIIGSGVVSILLGYVAIKIGLK